MIIFIKKIKTKEGINAFDNEKVKKSIPVGYKIANQEPIITLTANHVLIAYRCEKVEKPVPAPKPAPAPKAIKTARPVAAPNSETAPKVEAPKKDAPKDKSKPKKAVGKKAVAKA